MTKMKKKIVLLGILLIILGIMGIGCYTVLTHTRVQGEGEEAEYTGQYYREHCTDCHQDYHNFPYGFYYGYYPDYYWSNPRWGHYYAYPWWWDRYWGNDYSNDNGGVEQTPESAEKAERRRGLEPPYVLPQGTSNTPLVLPPGSTKQEETPQVKQEEKPKAVEIPKKQEQEQKKEKSDEQKAERRRKE